MAADDETMRAAILIQVAFRRRLARHIVSDRRKLQQLWIEGLDEEGLVYYYNTESGEWQYEKPAAYVAGGKTDAMIMENMRLAIAGKKMLDSEVQLKMKALKKVRKKEEMEADWNWVEVYDPETKQFYYWHQLTHEYSWEKPQSYILAADDEMMKAAILVQSVWKARQARNIAASKRRQMQQVWVEGHDEAGHAFYYNIETGDWQYEKPVAFVAGSKTDEDILKNVKLAMAGKKMIDAEMHEKLKKAKEDRILEESHADWHWVEVFDPETERFYYWHQETHEYSWDKPSNYILAADDETMKAAILVQSAWKIRKARYEVHERRKMQRLWVQRHDGNGDVIYYNTESGVMQYEKPVAFIAGAKTDAMILDNMKLAFEGKSMKVVSAEMQNKIDFAKEARLWEEAEADWNWVEVYDPATEKFYYWNQHTHEITWDKPPSYILAADDDTMKAAILLQSAWKARQAIHKVHERRQLQQLWVEGCDDEGNLYYYNTAANDWQYDKPAAFVAGAKTDAMILKNMKLAFEGKKMEDSEVQLKLAVANKARRIEEAEADWNWVEVYDPATENFYYWNQRTHEITWDKPLNYILAADDEMMKAAIMLQNAWKVKQAKSLVNLRRKLQQKWIEAFDDSGTPYYYNRDTMEVVWDKPAEFIAGAKTDAEILGNMKLAMKGRKMDSADEQKRLAKIRAKRLKEESSADWNWVEVYDSASEKFYYWNSTTGEVVWTKPERYIMAADDDLIRSAIKLQSAFRARLAREGISLKRKGKCPWVKIIDTNLDMPYYYHKDTMEVQWEPPMDFVISNKSDDEILASAKKAMEGRLLTGDMQQRYLAVKQARLETEAKSDLDWVEIYDCNREKFYYWHRKTNVII